MSTLRNPVLRTWETALTEHATSVCTARRLIRDQLTSWGWAGEPVDDLVLIASELVTNAVVHACHGHGEVRLYLQEFDGDCRLEVWDPRGDLPLREPRPRRFNEGGRGIQLARRIAFDFGVITRRDEGKRVWARVLRAANSNVPSPES
ncbi:anti-sigma regulatory factor (Ser/Thr protein kinase) [Kitasatospora sp. MAA19]|uniref:ATP-binding protein n=1 Tax=unclassified Kitasatospora TaxID=2633591 RepID=UPI002474F983|nr:ATP-binding protein [Kitasatospora sp. MAA19]MDH6708585.1 anti-sigma regulatory factor (Ser/Thr protein kinase) [Kitasatospora sp. MAA19]